MTKAEFLKYQSGTYVPDMTCLVSCEESAIVPGQAMSILELFERTEKGLPIPDLSGGYSFNGRTIEDLTPADKLGADISVVYNEYQRLQKDVSKEIKRVAKPKKEE